MGGISIWQLVIVLVIVLFIFGTKKFKNIGGDLGSAVKGFKSAMSDGEQDVQKKTSEQLDKKPDSAAIDVEVTKKEESKKDV